MAFVLDASIAIAWVVPSQATPYTRRIRLLARREPYLVPAIFAAKVTNMLVTLERRGILSERGAEAAADVLRRLHPIVHPMSLGISELRNLANRFGLTAYDASEAGQTRSAFSAASRRGLIEARFRRPARAGTRISPPR